MSDKGEIGVVDSCETCKRVKWAGYGRECPSCAALRKMRQSPNNAVVLDKVPEENR